MSRHLRRVRDDFPDATDTAPGGAAAGEVDENATTTVVTDGEPRMSAHVVPAGPRPAPKSRPRADDPTHR
jgi:hypothetical protein